VFDHLFFENASRDLLWWYFGFYTVGLVLVGVLLYTYAKELGKQ